ncbi:unnamed protein product [Acanthoscelides obtectus]|uniref:Uncharacterized protein n=1 Tax=Acanthoscelides obtectus TaxID=200917 RepID=A0A9P0KZ03_ACAOB|nr:unnamed protein product [Acanthoscelides obtectus]CAK1631916.1 hypothetical protein AOBTE_LOCUS7236 [Acanthoscelides obtectus]
MKIVGESKNLKEDLPTLIKLIPGLSWKCNTCLSADTSTEDTDLGHLIESKISHALDPVVLLINQLISAVEQTAWLKPETTSADRKVSYSSVLRKKTVPAVTIKPKEVQDTLKTKTDILKNMNPVADDIHISKIKNVKDGGILIGCKNVEDNLKLDRIVQEKLSYDVKKVGGVNPRGTAGCDTMDSSRELSVSCRAGDMVVLSILKTDFSEEFSDGDRGGGGGGRGGGGGGGRSFTSSGLAGEFSVSVIDKKVFNDSCPYLGTTSAPAEDVETRPAVVDRRFAAALAGLLEDVDGAVVAEDDDGEDDCCCLLALRFAFVEALRNKSKELNI